MTGARKALLSGGRVTPRTEPGLWGWWKTENAVFDGSDRVSSITAQQGPDWIQNAAGDQGLYVPNAYNGLPVVRFNSVNEFMTLSVNSVLPQPLTFYMVLKQITWTSDRRVLGSFDAAGSLIIYQYFNTNRIAMNALTGYAEVNAGITALGLLSSVAAGASASATQWNNGTANRTNVGTTEWRGGCLGATNSAAPTTFSNIDVAEICVFQAAHSDAQRERLWKQYFKPRYNL